MEALIIDQGIDTPGVILDPVSGKFKIFGKSFPEDALTFYQPVFDWLDAFSKNPMPKTEFVFQLKYINSISTKMVLDMLRLISLCMEKDSSIKVIWEYTNGNEDLQEQGEEYGEIIGMPIVCRAV